MKKDNNERLSALIDGENCDDTNVLEKLIINDDMKNTWQRYHLIGDCLRGNLPDKIHSNYLKDLSKLLHNEPTLLSPKKNKLFNREPLIGFAIAASVATLAILNIQNENNVPFQTTTESVVMDEKIIVSHETQKSKEGKREKVFLEIVTDTKSYPAIYYMYLNNQDKWMLYNTIGIFHSHTVNEFNSISITFTARVSRTKFTKLF